MKKFPVFILMVSVTMAAAFVYGDVYIKQKLHTDAYYYSGVNHPAEDSIEESWLGGLKIVFISGSSMTIIDKEKSRALIIDKKGKTYVETTLPIDLSKLAPEPVAPIIREIRFKGTVKETGKTRTIGNWRCKEYAINTYGESRGERNNELDTTLWAAANLPFDMDKYRDLFFDLYRLKNYSDELIEEMKKIDGFRIAAQSFFYPKGFSVKITTEVVEISEKEPPAGIYTLPEGCVKKEKFSIEELRRLFE
jgi:hypothetical protein